MSPVGRRIEVQGVGFRPCVYRLAQAAGLCGRVYSDGRGVVIDAFGEPSLLDRFAEAIEREPLAAASVQWLRSRPLLETAPAGFAIATSRSETEGATPRGPDRAACRESLAELLDSADRRYRYPFLECTVCGLRFTIVERTPYDRARTSIAVFTMCPACQREHSDPARSNHLPAAAREASSRALRTASDPQILPRKPNPRTTASSSPLRTPSRCSRSPESMFSNTQPLGSRT